MRGLPRNKVHVGHIKGAAEVRQATTGGDGSAPSAPCGGAREKPASAVSKSIANRVSAPAGMLEIKIREETTVPAFEPGWQEKWW